MRPIALWAKAVFAAAAGAAALAGQAAPGAETADAAGRTILVGTQDAYFEAAENAEPGDRIVLQNGVWRDFDMLLHAEGAATAPIHVTAETPGEVVLSGRSSLRLAGRHLVVSGLVFRDGYTPRAEVVSFRRDDAALAFDSRVTETVIENYSNPDRTQRDIWVVMYGRNNVFDRNHLSGKRNAGPTMAVRLNSEDSRNNDHLIAHNYFGPRPVFGSNGGETIRIGTSHFSRTRSGARVENNYFDRCSGEVEIISNKSGGNTFRGNTFFQSRGTLTLRHGDDTLVEGNLFDGGGAAYTGGVRVINARQTVRNNHFVDLTGERFSGALVVMNGVPNSPINRYHQVDGAVIEGNSFNRVRRIELGEGSDAERSAVPINSAFRDNVVIGETDASPFRVQDDLSGVAFTGNIAAAPPPPEIADGFEIDTPQAAASRLSDPADFGVARDETGVDWHPKASLDSPFDGGRRIPVEAGADTLGTALAAAKAGDSLVLAPGRYAEFKLSTLTVPVTIEAADPGAPPLVTFERPNLIVLAGEGALRLRGLAISGAAAPDASGNSVITTAAARGARNHIVEFEGVTVMDADVNRGFSVISATKGTFFDRITITDSAFSDVSGVVVKLDAETDGYGIYSAEYVVIENSAFTRIGGPVVSVLRGGRDESTFGPHVWVRGSRFDGAGLRGGPMMALHGVQDLELTGNRAANAKPAEFTVTTGIPRTTVSGNQRVDADTSPILTTVDLRPKP